MFELSKLQINRLADAADFNRNTTEKVLRLYAILKFINESKLKGCLALKGGTAINLFLLDLPRLSVDIDLDFNLDFGREEMLEKRQAINKCIRDFMADEGYQLSDKSKFVHTLDSFVYSYATTSGGRDVLKIEINYSDRIHILETVKKESTSKLGETISVLRLADDELIGSKINALLVRTTPRDIYDVYMLFQNGNIVNAELIRKIAIFYACLGSEIPVDFEQLLSEAIAKIKALTYKKVKETLIPVLHKGAKVNMEEISGYVVGKKTELFALDDNDNSFIQEYNLKHFRPDILFQGEETRDVSNHPMGIWKTQ